LWEIITYDRKLESWGETHRGRSKVNKNKKYLWKTITDGLQLMKSKKFDGPNAYRDQKLMKIKNICEKTIADGQKLKKS
jgi:hypothetical protein